MPLSDIVSQLEPEIRPVDMLVDRQAAVRLDAAERAVKQAELRVQQAEEAEKGQMSKPQVAQAKRDLDEASGRLAKARDQAAAKRVTVYLRELGADRWRELIWLVPPTDAQRARFEGRRLDHNPELFPLVALAFSLVDVDRGEDGTLTATGPAVDQDELDGLEAALQKAAGDPKRAEKACDEHLPEPLVELNRKMRAGGWEHLTNVLFELNLEVSQVPLSLSGSDATGSS